MCLTIYYDIIPLQQFSFSVMFCSQFWEATMKTRHCVLLHCFYDCIYIYICIIYYIYICIYYIYYVYIMYICMARIHNALISLQLLKIEKMKFVITKLCCNNKNRENNLKIIWLENFGGLL